jgi:hypothetical protein
VPSWLVGLVAAVAACLLLLAGAWLAGRARGRRARGRNRIAQRGEAEAVRLLERAGYAIEGRGVAREGSMRVDGETLRFGVRADLVARCRRGRLFVVEVKTGALAPDPRHGPTRRQLLEYAMIFGTPHLLLVDMDARRVHEIGFAIPEGLSDP